jgi:hypothetical protein
MLNLKYAEESSRMRICVVSYTNFNVSGEPAASISGQNVVQFSTLKMNAVCYSDIVVPVYKIILRYFPRQNSLIT